MLGSSEGKKAAKKGPKVEIFYGCVFWDTLYFCWCLFSINQSIKIILLNNINNIEPWLTMKKGWFSSCSFGSRSVLLAKILLSFLYASLSSTRSSMNADVSWRETVLSSYTYRHLFEGDPRTWAFVYPSSFLVLSDNIVHSPYSSMKRSFMIYEAHVQFLHLVQFPN